MPLGKRTDCGDAKYSGVEVPFACDIVETLQVDLVDAHVQISPGDLGAHRAECPN